MGWFPVIEKMGRHFRRARAARLAAARKRGATFAGLEGLEPRALLSGFNPAQQVNAALTPVQLAQSLVGAGLTVSNVSYTGGAGATGGFAFTDPTVVGFGQGIILSSGNAADVVGPNLGDSTSTDFALPGDATLDALSGFTTFDAAVLEFDFVPTANQVVFSYVFASDEYPEWVTTPFNDVFAFLVNGVNYATVRQTAGDPNAPFVPVAVNTINNGNPIYPDAAPARPDLFRPNYYNPDGTPSVIDLEQDGLTHVLTFQAPVTPGVPNHMKLAIADASDGIYDSAVFIQAGSLVSNENPVADLSLTPETGGAPLLVTAAIEGEDPNGLPISYTIDWGDGSATSTGPLTLPLAESEKTALVSHTYDTPGKYLVTLTVSNGSLVGASTEDVDVLGSGSGGGTGGGGGGTTEQAPVVTLNPTDLTVNEGELILFFATASGSPTPSVQWQVSTDQGDTFLDIPGATDFQFVATASLGDNGAIYQAVFTNSEGDAVSGVATLTVLPVDSTPPAAPVVALAQDTGLSATDLLTRVGELTLSEVEPDASVEYSPDGGATWSPTFAAAEGENNVLVRQIDAAGNVGEPASLSFTLDTSAPASPVVALAQDTGLSATDRVTRLGALTLSEVEPDASVEYSPDGGATWSPTFAAHEGVNSLRVRQADAAGNIGEAASLSFTLDTTPPQLHPSISTAQAILVNATGVTASANATDAVGLASQSALVALNTSGAGRKSVTLYATDLAGNSASADLSYVVGYAATKVSPLAGATYKRKATIAVSFQLVDAKGLISDATAGALVSSIKVALGTLAPVGVTYNKKTKSFSASVKVALANPGNYDLSIFVTVSGVNVTTVIVPIKVI